MENKLNQEWIDDLKEHKVIRYDFLNYITDGYVEKIGMKDPGEPCFLTKKIVRLGNDLVEEVKTCECLERYLSKEFKLSMSIESIINYIKDDNEVIKNFFHDIATCAFSDGMEYLLNISFNDTRRLQDNGSMIFYYAKARGMISKSFAKKHNLDLILERSKVMKDIKSP